MPALKKATGNLTVTLEELSQEVNLANYLGRKPTSIEKELFASMAIEVINTRTLDGQTINNGKFTKYSKDYADKKGVTRDSVDLFLEGDMLNSIGRRTSKEKSDTVFIQVGKGLDTKKAYNHNVGDTLPKREFFGITDNEARNIARQIEQETPRQQSQSISLLQQAINQLGLIQEE